MESKTYALFTGIFFVVLLALGAALAVWMTRDRGTYGQALTFVSDESVTGLNREAAVLFRGIPVGKVTDLRINPDRQQQVVITARLAQPLRLSDETTARLLSQGITGLSNIELVDNGGKTLLDQDRARIPLEPSSLQRVGASLPEAVDAVRQLASSLNDTFNPQMQQDLQATLHSVRLATDEIPVLVASARTSLGKFDQLTTDLRGLTGGLRTQVGSLQTATTDTLAGIRDMAGNIDRSAARVDRTVLPRLEQSLQGVDELVTNLNAVAVEQRNNPQSLLFGRQPARPGPGEHGFGG